jgi:hypothetical protein
MSTDHSDIVKQLQHYSTELEKVLQKQDKELDEIDDVLFLMGSILVSICELRNLPGKEVDLYRQCETLIKLVETQFEKCKLTQLPPRSEDQADGIKFYAREFAFMNDELKKRFTL